MLAAFAPLGLLLATGTILHSHVDAGSALYNQEHDLTLVSLIGVIASAALDVPTGATVVCAFGATLVACWLLGLLAGWPSGAARATLAPDSAGRGAPARRSRRATR